MRGRCWEAEQRGHRAWAGGQQVCEQVCLRDPHLAPSGCWPRHQHPAAPKPVEQPASCVRPAQLSADHTSASLPAVPSHWRTDQPGMPAGRSDALDHP